MVMPRAPVRQGRDGSQARFAACRPIDTIVCSTTHRVETVSPQQNPCGFAVRCPCRRSGGRVAIDTPAEPSSAPSADFKACPAPARRSIMVLTHVPRSRLEAKRFWRLSGALQCALVKKNACPAVNKALKSTKRPASTARRAFFLKRTGHRTCTGRRFPKGPLRWPRPARHLRNPAPIGHDVGLRQ